MNGYMNGIYGDPAALGGGAANMVNPVGVQGNISASGGFGGTGAATQSGPLALLVLLAGVTIFYFATRKMQGSL